MKRILLCGCNGKMGRVITSIVESRQDCEIVAGIDIHTEISNSYPVFESIHEANCKADVLIDFSHPALLSDILIYVQEKKMPAVICTTGYSKAQVEEIAKASQNVPVFHSGNMSLGINLLIELSKRAAAVLSNQYGFDIEIVEKHHNQKLDAPSGTALMIADGISEVLDQSPRYMYDRHSQRKKRDPHEIGIHSIRGGSIVGEHEVIFAGQQEVISISHSAQSREILAVGGVNAAMFLSDKPAGLYDMGHLLSAIE